VLNAESKENGFPVGNQKTVTVLDPYGPRGSKPNKPKTDKEARRKRLILESMETIDGGSTITSLLSFYILDVHCFILTDMLDLSR
jgi:hypothetical protein